MSETFDDLLKMQNEIVKLITDYELKHRVRVSVIDYKFNSGPSNSDSIFDTDYRSVKVGIKLP